MDDESIPYAERLFIHGANQLNAIIEEIGIGPVYRMEDLTTSVEALRALVDHLTGSVVKTSAEWARAAIDTSRANAHVTTAAPFTERQLDIVRRVVRPDAWRFYRNLGYDAPDL
jgi:outer membrane murein-binding lipoprotein Lpp